MDASSTVHFSCLRWQSFQQEVSHGAHRVAQAVQACFSYICDYDYRCSALYGSSLPFAVPISLIGIGQCIRDLVQIENKKKPVNQASLKRVLAISDLVVGFSGLVRPFCITVIALSFFSRIEPIVQGIAAPLSLVSSVFNSCYAISVIIRGVLGCKKVSAMRAQLTNVTTPFHYYFDHQNTKNKELSYEFQSDGKKMRATFKSVAEAVDRMDGEKRKSEATRLTALFNTRMVHRRISDVISVAIAIVSIVSAICFFVWAGTVLAPLAWMIALAVCAISLGKYIYDRKITENFQKRLDEVILA